MKHLKQFFLSLLLSKMTDCLTIKLINFKFLIAKTMFSKVLSSALKATTFLILTIMYYFELFFVLLTVTSASTHFVFIYTTQMQKQNAFNVITGKFWKRLRIATITFYWHSVLPSENLSGKLKAILESRLILNTLGAINHNWNLQYVCNSLHKFCLLKLCWKGLISARMHLGFIWRLNLFTEKLSWYSWRFLIVALFDRNPFANTKSRFFPTSFREKWWKQCSILKKFFPEKP